MAEAVQGVEGERRGEDELAGVLDGFGQAPDQFHDVCRAEGFGRDEVGECIAVEDLIMRGMCGVNVGSGQERVEQATHGHLGPHQ